MEITSLVVVALQITTRDATDSALVAEKVIKKITRSLRSLDDFFIVTASPSQQDTRRLDSNDPFSDFNDDFQSEFTEMDRDDRINSEIEAGFDKWEDRCLRVGRQEALDKWLKGRVTR